jgi:hypothetical protein
MDETFQEVISTDTSPSLAEYISKEKKLNEKNKNYKSGKLSDLNNLRVSLAI